MVRSHLERKRQEKIKTHGQRIMLRAVQPTKLPQVTRRATARQLMDPRGETVVNGLKKANAQEVTNVHGRIPTLRPRQVPEVDPKGLMKTLGKTVQEKKKGTGKE